MHISIVITADVVSLIETWLTERIFYVSVNGDNSCMTKSDTGTIQGLILGTIHYAIFMVLLFDPKKLTNYMDDMYIVRWNSYMKSLIFDMRNPWKSSQSGPRTWVLRSMKQRLRCVISSK